MKENIICLKCMKPVEAVHSFPIKDLSVDCWMLCHNHVTFERLSALLFVEKGPRVGVFGLTDGIPAERATEVMSYFRY